MIQFLQKIYDTHDDFDSDIDKYPFLDRYHKLHKAFSNFNRRHFELIEKISCQSEKNLCNKVFLRSRIRWRFDI